MIFLDAFIIGFTVASLPGAVQTTVLQSSVMGKTKDSLLLALGASSMDGLFLVLAYIGVIQFIVHIVWLKLALGLAGVAYMLLLGVSGLLTAVRKDKKIKLVDKKTFWNGALLILLHPPTFLYFVGVASTLFVMSNYFLYQIIISSFFLAVGAFVCFVIVAGIGSVVHKIKVSWIVSVFHILVSCVLIFFAVKLFFQII